MWASPDTVKAFVNYVDIMMQNLSKDICTLIQLMNQVYFQCLKGLRASH
jgi:hypothetical protein